MRVYIIVVSLALLVTGKANGTIVDSGEDAQKFCQQLVEGASHDSASRSAGACEGMIETAMFFARNLPADVRSCPPAQGSVLERAKVLLRYLDNNPDRMSDAGITLTFEALRDAWPCLGDDSDAPAKPKKRAPKKSSK